VEKVAYGAFSDTSFVSGRERRDFRGLRSGDSDEQVRCGKLIRQWPWSVSMCRNIRTLFNFEPPATDDEVRAASLQFVRKLSGFNVPSKANQAAFDRAIEDVAAAASALINSLVTTAEPRDREIEAARAKERSAARFPR
jgi:hypothetical protein